RSLRHRGPGGARAPRSDPAGPPRGAPRDGDHDRGRHPHPHAGAAGVYDRGIAESRKQKAESRSEPKPCFLLLRYLLLATVPGLLSAKRVVAAPVIDEWLASGGADGPHRGDADEVIAAGQKLLQVAGQPGDRLVQHRHAVDLVE